MGEWTLPERFETPGGTVRWARRGKGSPVVLLHGTPFSSWVWQGVATALAGRHEVYVWDLLGYGESDKWSGQDVSLRAQLASRIAGATLTRIAGAGHLVQHDASAVLTAALLDFVV